MAEILPAKDTPNVVEKLSEIVAVEIAKQADAMVDAVKSQLLGRRMKYAETPEILSETGMTIEQVREFNAYSDGYNDRAKHLEATIIPSLSAEPELVEVVAIDTKLTQENVNGMLEAVIKAEPIIKA